MEAVMAFPDRIERTVELAHPPERVWVALTTAEGLGAWFGDEAAIDLRPGGSAWMRWSGEGFTALTGHLDRSAHGSAATPHPPSPGTT
jgi:uncharacterized protein YndB with AHSA1/START domain